MVSVEADTVVIVGHNSPEHGLADFLRNHPVEMHVIGEAAGKTTLQESLAEAVAVGRRI